MNPFHLLPLVSWRQIVRWMLLFVAAVLTGTLCLHILAIAGILVRSLLLQP